MQRKRDRRRWCISSSRRGSFTDKDGSFYCTKQVSCAAAAAGIAKMSSRRDAVADLVIRNGRILDPASGLDLVAGDVAVTAGKISAVGGAGLEGKEEFDASGMIVSAGWVDLHTHVYEHCTTLGVNADKHCLARGVCVDSNFLSNIQLIRESLQRARVPLVLAKL